MDQTSTRDDNFFDTGQVFTLLHKGLTHHGIGFRNRARVSCDRFLDCTRCERKVECLQLLVTVWHTLLVCIKLRHKLKHSVFRKTRQCGNFLHTDGIEDNIVTEYERRFMEQGLPIYRVEATPNNN